MDQHLKIGLIGGSFNPPTRGHANMAMELLRSKTVDTVWFVPTGHHPFEGGVSRKNHMAPYRDRVDMLWSMIEDMPLEYRNRVHVCEVDNRPEKTYTVDTIKILASQYPGHHFYWVVGTDCVNEFEKWRNIDEILQMATIIVYPRGGVDPLPNKYWGPLNQNHIVLATKNVVMSDCSSSTARENPDGGLLSSSVKLHWKRLVAQGVVGD